MRTLPNTMIVPPGSGDPLYDDCYELHGAAR